MASWRWVLFINAPIGVAVLAGTWTGVLVPGDTERGKLDVTVRHGVVTLTGTMRPESGQEQDLIPLALRLIWDIDGVVDVVNKLGELKASKPAKPA